MVIAVVDGMGGGAGKAMVEALLKTCPDAEIWALGTNALATAAMKKAGAHKAATGENAICVSCRKADIIVGSLGIVLAESMMGEVTPRMAHEISACAAPKILAPTNRCHVTLVGLRDMPMGQQVEELAQRGTMEIADRIYGVTMQERGISKVLALDINQAEEKLGENN